jgi:hypothetical protein
MLCRKDMTCMLVDCSENTDAHSECAIFGAFPWQQWLRICASMLHYTHICLLRFSWQLLVILFGQPEDRDSIFLWNAITHIYHTAQKPRRRPSNKGTTQCVRKQKTVIWILTTVKTLYFVSDFTLLFTRNKKLAIRTRCLHSVFRKRNWVEPASVIYSSHVGISIVLSDKKYSKAPTKVKTDVTWFEVSNDADS